MRNAKTCLAVFLLLGGILRALPAMAGGPEDYQRYCASCHGARGNGAGPMAHLLDPRPRDFTRGSFKFRSTPSGALPTDADLMEVVTNGLRGTPMVGFQAVLTTAERRAVLDVVKGFSPRFRSEPAPPVTVLPPRTAEDAGTLARGQRIYAEMKCAECHGETGRGDGPASETMVDDLGRRITASDLTRTDDIRRRQPRAMMRVMMTGLDGTPMPSYADVISGPDAWDLVRYLVSLQARPSFWNVLFDRPFRWRAGR